MRPSAPDWQPEPTVPASEPPRAPSRPAIPPPAPVAPHAEDLLRHALDQVVAEAETLSDAISLSGPIPEAELDAIAAVHRPTQAELLAAFYGPEAAERMLGPGMTVLDADLDAAGHGSILVRLDPQAARITELQQDGNRLLQEARDERASHARTRWLLEQATTRGLVLESQLRRLDPAWRDT